MTNMNPMKNLAQDNEFLTEFIDFLEEDGDMDFDPEDLESNKDDVYTDKKKSGYPAS